MLQPRSASSIVKSHEALASGLNPSKSWLTHLPTPINRFAKSPHLWQTVHFRNSSSHLHLDTFCQNHNINDNFSSFDFISHPWCRMLDAGMLRRCICIILVECSNHDSRFFDLTFSWHGISTNLKFLGAIILFQWFQTCFQLTSTAAARSPWNEPVPHQRSKAAAFDCSKQDWHRPTPSVENRV